VTIAAGTRVSVAEPEARETERGNLGYNVRAVVCRRGLLTVLLCALVGVPSALAVNRPPVVWSPAGSGSNFTPALHRTIDRIVIHATDGGSLIGNVSWLAGDRSEASAHYVVSRDGQIVQLVPLHDIAWHSGNRAMNAHSIGVEHLGETFDPAGFTPEEYRASARLVAWLARRYRIPIDRRHIIGHAQVPDPFHPGTFGGSDHHSDPGPYWRWGYYLKLVRKLAFPNTLKVNTTTIEPGATLRGIVPWHVRTGGGRAARVEFLVDGRPVWSDARRPFAFGGGRGLNTTTLSNGTHVLTVRAAGKGGRASQRLVVDVANHAFALTTAGLRPWQRAKGVLRVRAHARGAKATVIGLYVDGHVVSRDRSAPYTLRWDTRAAHDGLHRVSLVATSTDRRLVKRRIPVVVSNHVPKPKPTPKPKRSAPPQITAANVADGETVSGVVDWRAHTTGPVARVEFSVDGVVVARQTREPWTTAWDSSTASPGAHRLEVDAYTRDGQKAALVATVTLAPSTP
jgi:N-acetylmuramoyl-L-alanine amidase-like protein/Big-like domain-containing protein